KRSNSLFKGGFSVMPDIGASVIQIENNNPGSTDWQLSDPALEREIAGYASLTSVNSGKSISFYVSTRDGRFQIEFFRMGWYNRAGARLMPVNGSTAPIVLNGRTSLHLPLIKMV